MSLPHDRLLQIEARYEQIEQLLADPATLARPGRLQNLAQELAELEKLVEIFRKYKQTETSLKTNGELLQDSDPELKGLAREEEGRLLAVKRVQEEQLRSLLLPGDPNDSRNTLLEIRAGAGGEEAALFAAELFRMYSRLADRKKWQVEILSQSESTTGGYKEIVALVSGNKVYAELKYESGVHRVQRIPHTETQGRTHTSTATVVVLPETEDIDIKIENKDLRIDVMRSGGPGGQSVNTTDSAVQITHLPSGIIVRCQQEKSQHNNRATALKILKLKLLEIEQNKQETAEREARRSQVKSGDRAEKIRTYNFAQDRVTEHRIDLTKHNLLKVLDGDLQDIIDSLRTHYQAEALKG